MFGTGKTTWLSRRVADAVVARGPDDVMVTSFSKAAAVKVATRIQEDLTPVDMGKVGTLHALCYRAMGTPTIAETKIDEWNNAAGYYHKLSGSRLDANEPDEYQPKTDGDVLLQQCNLLRARMTPDELWPNSARVFHAAWCAWKQETGYIDFTEMIEYALKEMPLAPGDPSVIMADEAQDFSKLELALIRKWGEQADVFVMVADEDQLLYSFKGASADSFLTPLPADRKRILKQSFRVPRAIHQWSQAWIEKVSTREKKEYLPRDADGEVVHRPDITWTNPDRIVGILEQAESNGQTTMILASCGYMLAPTIHILRSNGFLFHNPFRRSRGDWNPVRSVWGHTSTAQRILSFFKPYPEVWQDKSEMWSWSDLKEWMGLVSVEGILKRGAKREIEGIPEYEMRHRPEISELLKLFEDTALTKLLDLAGDVKGGGEWLREHALSSKRNAIEYPLTAITKRGPRALFSDPKIIPGTIHSVKGEEADVVVIMPDLSPSGMAQWFQQSEGGHDAIIRCFYVASTRAKEKLVICGPASGLNVQL